MEERPGIGGIVRIDADRTRAEEDTDQQDRDGMIATRVFVGSRRYPQPRKADVAD